ncbi:aminotransferase-like domain-containing protein [Vibrio salinus]|uniref:aminotransferase-like domain-containing protein n=1 Tax=Vibrio salinus TaxID=2899784 RepID=UPI001E38E626|nr:PLP-dependent aminotransferase family protein [Vibrio salinus]MCE0495822.1 PLP-dependent aminotransferase family protein [Vibrio salinus]
MEIAQSLQNVQSSYIREILEAASAPDVISLAGGLPDKTTFPINILRPIFESLADNEMVFQYGNTAGYTPLLNHLKKRYQLPEHHAAVVTTGSQQGLDLLARAYINPGDKIAMEAPSYLGAMQVFGLVQADILPIPQNAEGPDLQALEICFREHKPKLFYTVPDFHNPTGVSWSLPTRRKVAELCNSYGVTLVEDAPYRELRFTDVMLPMSSSFCPDNSIVLRSFSKIASPGLRIGVATGKASLINPMIKVKQGADLHSSIPMQALLVGLLTDKDFDSHLVNVRKHYAEKYYQMEKALKAYLPNSCSFEPAKGGMFVWVSVPECDTFELASRSLKNKVAVVPSTVFYPKNVTGKSALRLNFTNSTGEEMQNAIKCLSKVIEDFTAEQTVA